MFWASGGSVAVVEDTGAAVRAVRVKLVTRLTGASLSTTTPTGQLDGRVALTTTALVVVAVLAVSDA